MTSMSSGKPSHDSNGAMISKATIESFTPALQVSWQTIFWILINLAIGAMAQPGGRICGFSSRYRTYLRCSPLICGADMVSMVLRLLVTTAYLRLSLLESVGILLHDRFNTDDQITPGRDQYLDLQTDDTEGEGGGIQTLETLTWLRWLWFLLGTLPPTIKLASMSGVGWAQTWGMMFLGSWVINELLIIFATLNQSFFTITRSGRIAWPGYERVTQSTRYKQVQRYLDLCEKCLGLTALLVHVVVMNNIFRIISRQLDRNYPSSTIDISRAYVRSVYVSIVSGAVWVPAGLIIFIFGRKYSILTFLFLGLLFIMLGNSAANSLVLGKHVLSPSGSFTSIAVWISSTVTISVLLLVLRVLGQRFIMVGRNLLVLYRSGTQDQFSIDYKACLALIFFFSTLVTSLFWYGKMYDASGTSMPIWTGVFG